MFVQMRSSKPPNILFPNLVLWCIIMSLSVMQKDWFAIFKVRITARTHMIKIWLTFSELLIPWQPSLVWWYIIGSQSVLWKKNGLLHSQWRVRMLMFVQMISSKPPNILFTNLVLWCIIMSLSVMQKDWFAIFKINVTPRTHIIKIWQFLLYLLNHWSFCSQTWLNGTLS